MICASVDTTLDAYLTVRWYLILTTNFGIARKSTGIKSGFIRFKKFWKSLRSSNFTDTGVNNSDSQPKDHFQIVYIFSKRQTRGIFFVCVKMSSNPANYGVRLYIFSNVYFYIFTIFLICYSIYIFTFLRCREILSCLDQEFIVKKLEFYRHWGVAGK